MALKQVIFRIRNKLESTHEDICRMRRNFPNGEFKLTYSDLETGESGYWVNSADIRLFFITEGDTQHRIFGLKLNISPSLTKEQYGEARSKYLKYFKRLYKKLDIALKNESIVRITVDKYYKSEDACFSGKQPKRARVYINKSEDSSAPDFEFRNDGMFEFYTKSAVM